MYSSLFLSIACFTIIIIMLIRNEIVFKCRVKALSILRSRLFCFAYRELPYPDDFLSRYDSYGSYNAMMLKLFKWRFVDFYPDLGGG